MKWRGLAGARHFHKGAARLVGDYVLHEYSSRRAELCSIAHCCSPRSVGAPKADRRFSNEPACGGEGHG